jgi:hypothetical protein
MIGLLAICAMLFVASILVNWWFQMSSLDDHHLDTRLAAITDSAANLKAQLFELERLREQVGKALRSAEKSHQPKRRNGHCAVPLEIDREPAFGH